MIKLLMKTLKLIRTKEENSDMKYAALCTGCGAIVPFDIEFSTNVTINYQNTAADRFECNCDSGMHRVHFSCKECRKSQQNVRFKPVLVIPKELAKSTKTIIDSGIDVRGISNSSVYYPYINMSDGEPEFYTILPIYANIEIKGKQRYDEIYDLINSLIAEQYKGIFNCQGCRIMSEEEACQIEDNDDSDADITLEDLNTPENDQLYTIIVHQDRDFAGFPKKVKTEEEINYELIKEINNNFTKLVSAISDAIAQTKSE